MNANELADELEILNKQLDQAIDLIGQYKIQVRQQQAEIEHLKELFEKAMRMIEK
jgi:hypothetical protein